MKAISIRQPWAWAILYAGKDVENRSWPSKIRGRVAIHAAKTPNHNDLARLRRRGIPVPDMADLPRGALVGSVEIVDCVSESPSPWFTGPFGFLLRDPRPLAESIPWTGSRHFWDLPDDVIPAEQS